MTRQILILAAFALLGIVASPRALAQGEDITAAGKVTAKSGTSISIATGDKQTPTQTFVVNDQTVVRRARAPITIEAVEVGELAGVVGKKVDGQLVATVIETRAKR
jgi:Domain of unknown function (DUF5666)